MRTLLPLLGPLLLVLLGVPALRGTAAAAAPPAGQTTRYTMTAFTNPIESNMYVYDSPEGPALVPLDNGGRRIHYDGYSAGKYWYSDSYDNFATWTTPTELPGLTGFARHLTVLKETVSGGVTLPTNTTRSLQSVNYPSRYAVARSDNLGYIDPVSGSSTTAVKQSATLTVVPGLADANCYSFRDSSGRYLRHLRRYDCALPVDLFQNTDTFRADSSLTGVTPWA